MLIHIVADYGQGDLAFAEVVQRIKLHLPDATGEETVWMELFLRGGSAWEEFGRPPVGSEVRIEAGA